MKERLIDCPIPGKEAGAHKINLYEWGNKENPKILFCVHGLTRNGRDFDFLAMDMENEYKIICPDVAGRGKSQWLTNPSDYNYMTYVADMLHIMQELKIHSMNWVGTSMGGLIGMMIAANVPGVIEKLVVNDIGPYIPGKAMERIGSYVGNAPIFKDEEQVREYFEKILAPFGICGEKHLQHFIDTSVTESGSGGFVVRYDPAIAHPFRDEKGAPKPIEDINLWEVWEKISCPVLVLRGKESEILPEQVAQLMVKKANVELVEFDGIGHAPALCVPEQNKIIQNFLARESANIG